MALLFADENFPMGVVDELRNLGHDVLTIQQAGLAAQRTPDEEVLAFATINERAVLTLNRKHFFRLHRDRPQHAGIIACTFDEDWIGQAHRIHSGIASYGDLKGQLLRINRPS